MINFRFEHRNPEIRVHLSERRHLNEKVYTNQAHSDLSFRFVFLDCYKWAPFL